LKPKDLRDEFAMAAIIGMLSAPNAASMTSRQIAVYAGIVADQAMEEREKTNATD
jgi:hypothetical protein